MKGPEDIESYLLRGGLPFENLSPGIWNVKTEHEKENLLVSIAGPVVVFRVKLMELPRANREALFETLLRFNTTELIHGAYGIENEAVVVVSALPLENLDYNEFQSVIDDITLAVSKHYPTLSKFRAAA
jgi:hypothetical protein